MKAAMLDTNVVLGIMKNTRKALEKLKEFQDWQFVISYLVYAEIMAGAQLHEKRDTRKFLSRYFTIKNFDAPAHAQATKFLNTYFTGKENKPMDLMIAAHAKSLNMPVITNNAKDFIFTEVEVFYYSTN